MYIYIYVYILLNALLLKKFRLRLHCYILTRDVDHSVSTKPFTGKTTQSCTHIHTR